MDPVLLVVVAQLSAGVASWPVAYACDGSSRRVGTDWCPPGAWYHAGKCYPACTGHPDDVVCSCSGGSAVGVSLSPVHNQLCALTCPTGTRVSVADNCPDSVSLKLDLEALARTQPSCGHLDDPPCFIWQRLEPCDRGLRIDDHRCVPLPPGANAIIAQIGDWFVEFSASGQHVCVKAFEHIPVNVTALNQRLIGLGASAECARNFVAGFVCSIPQLADLSGGPVLTNIILTAEADPSCAHVPLPLKPLCAGVVILNEDVAEATACVVKAMHAGAFKGAGPSRPKFDPELCTQMGQIAFGAAQSRLAARIANSKSDLLIVRVARASLSIYNTASSPNGIVNVLRSIDSCAER